MKGWSEITVAELGQIVTGKTPSKDHPEEWGNDVLFLTPTDYNNCHKYVYNTLRKLSSVGKNNHKQRLIPKNSIMVTCIGSDMGKTLVSKYETVTNQQINSIIINDKYYVVDFIYYSFRNIENELKLLGGDGSAIPILNKSDFSNITFEIPTKTEQRAIATVLSNLDDKIDLLHRQNATLEAMAEALFRQWFVVEAKEEWKEKPLSGVASFLNGLACQKHRPANFVERLPVLKIRELSNGISQDSEWASSTVPKEYIVKFGDVIFSWSGSLLVKIWDGEDCVLNQHLFKVTSHEYPKWFYYFWCKQHLQEFISISESKATTMGHIKRGDLDAAMVKVPKRSEIESMSNIITPYLSKLEENKAQIRTLEKLRDTLLPKLMSGEVRVSLD